MGNKSSKSESDDSSEKEEQPSYYQMVKQGYNDLVNAIIRPPRYSYEMGQLGPKKFNFCGKSFQREDFELLNSRGLKIMCSLWEPASECRPNVALPCLIYMHGNSSARVEALGQLSLTLSLGATLVSFDFTGSGKSDGEYVSLGSFEKDDLKVVYSCTDHFLLIIEILIVFWFFTFNLI